jgi:hypothetical protein
MRAAAMVDGDRPIVIRILSAHDPPYARQMRSLDRLGLHTHTHTQRIVLIDRSLSRSCLADHASSSLI